MRNRPAPGCWRRRRKLADVSLIVLRCCPTPSRESVLERPFRSAGHPRTVPKTERAARRKRGGSRPPPRQAAQKPTKDRRLAANIVAIMRLTVLVDVVTIAASVAVILMSVNRGSKDAAKDCAGNRAGPWTDSRKNCAGDRAGRGADRRTADDVTRLRVPVISIAIVSVAVIAVRIIAVAVVAIVVAVRAISIAVWLGGAAGDRQTCGGEGCYKTKLPHRLIPSLRARSIRY